MHATNDPTAALPPAATRRGRRRILNEAKCRDVCTLVSAGCGIDDAARHVGCVPKTIFREARRNPEFGKSLQEAQTTAELTRLHAMRTAAYQNERAAAGPRERSNPNRFARLSVDTARPDDSQTFARDMSETIDSEVPDEEVREYLLGRIRDFTEEVGHISRMRKPFQRIDPNSYS